jgi:Ni/Fe-hydrogenase subunit HybB-like protein
MPVQGYMYPNEVELAWGILIVVYPFITGLVAGAFILACSSVSSASKPSSRPIGLRC